MKATAGDTITPAACKALADATGAGSVAPATRGGSGRGVWVCITCGALPYNNFEAHDHEAAHPKHKMAWRSFDSGLVEEP